MLLLLLLVLLLVLLLMLLLLLFRGSGPSICFLGLDIWAVYLLSRA